MHDSQLGDASLLETLHDLLNTGSTTGLFAAYEMDQIVAQISEALGLATDERVSHHRWSQSSQAQCPDAIGKDLLLYTAKQR